MEHYAKFANELFTPIMDTVRYQAVSAASQLTTDHVQGTMITMITGVAVSFLSAEIRRRSAQVVTYFCKPKSQTRHATPCLVTDELERAAWRAHFKDTLPDSFLMRVEINGRRMLSALDAWLDDNYKDVIFGDATVRLLTSKFAEIKRAPNGSTGTRKYRRNHHGGDASDEEIERVKATNMFPVWQHADRVIFMHWKPHADVLLLASNDAAIVNAWLKQFIDAEAAADVLQLAAEAVEAERLAAESAAANAAAAATTNNTGATMVDVDPMDRDASPETMEIRRKVRRLRVIRNATKHNGHAFDLLTAYRDRHHGNGFTEQSINYRWKFDAMVFAGKDVLVKYLTRFEENLDTDDAHTARRVGIMLSGKPGTGKSSFVAALSNFFHRDVAMVDFTLVDDREELKAAFEWATEKKHIIMLDEFDHLIESMNRRNGEELEQKRKEHVDSLKFLVDQSRGVDEAAHLIAKKNYLAAITAGKKAPIDISFLLTLFDSVGDGAGRVMVATTNHPENIDTRLLRANRFDVRMSLNFFTADEIRELLCLIYRPSAVDAAWLQTQSFASDVWSPAEVTAVHRKYGDLRLTAKELQENPPSAYGSKAPLSAAPALTLGASLNASNETAVAPSDAITPVSDVAALAGGAPALGVTAVEAAAATVGTGVVQTNTDVPTDDTAPVRGRRSKRGRTSSNTNASSSIDSTNNHKQSSAATNDAAAKKKAKTRDTRSA